MLRSIVPARLTIPFRQGFKHVAAERHATQTLWVRAVADDGLAGYGEGCPRDYVSAESLGTALAFVLRHRPAWLAEIRDLRDLRHWIALHRNEIDANPAAWSAVELALLDLIGKREHCSVERLLGVPELRGRFRYSAVLGDCAQERFAAQLDRFQKMNFRSFKIKLSADAGENEAKVRLLRQRSVGAESVRADANNLWSTARDCVLALEALHYRFWAVEEPVRAGDFKELRRVSADLSTRVILDESILREEQLAVLAEDADRWIVNIRVSKMGGLLRSLQLLERARSLGIDVIIGSHVGETSLLTRAALTLAMAAAGQALALEGGAGTHLLTRDVVDPPIMFGFGGCLDAGQMLFGLKSGLGLRIDQPL